MLKKLADVFRGKPQQTTPKKTSDTLCHPVFLNFEPWEGETDGINHYDFLGMRTDPKYWKNIRPQPKQYLKTYYPVAHEQYFEWVFLLEAVMECKARDSFTVMELGAGYGPWLVRSYLAFRRFSQAPVHLIGVEGDFNHYTWMREHFHNNCIDPDKHALHHACASTKPSTVAFFQSDDPRGDYGQRIYFEFGQFKEDERGGVIEKSGKKMQKIRALSLAELTEGVNQVDLVHMDIQGAEYGVLKAGIDALNKKVARVIIGAHSEEIERQLRELLKAEGWVNRYDFGRRSKVDTEWGSIEFRDGCQAWVNPRLVNS